MGSAASKETPPQANRRLPLEAEDCPVIGRDGSVGASTGTDSSCPIPERYRGNAVYNVYNQRIDGGGNAAPSSELNASNNMPKNAAQRPWEGQVGPLSTDRIMSSIPKGGTDGAWQYPSPQMFFNALMRKGKGEGVAEDLMGHVVTAHNSMNEATWHRVAEWERLHKGSCDEARLTRFMGRPDDLSPLARMKSWCGKQLPFDRHDWWVDRCGEEVRYVIDFYYNEDSGGTPDAFELEVRPALDTPTAALDRVKMNIYVLCARWGLPCPLTGHPATYAGTAQRHQQQQGQQQKQTDGIVE